MVTRRPPRALPGADPLMLRKVFLVIFLGIVVVILALTMATAAAIAARRVGHLPWPIAQWALTTPLGTLAVALVGGLALGLPFVLARIAGSAFTHSVDVTGLPLPGLPA